MRILRRIGYVLAPLSIKMNLTLWYFTVYMLISWAGGLFLSLRQWLVLWVAMTIGWTVVCFRRDIAKRWNESATLAKEGQ